MRPKLIMSVQERSLALLRMQGKNCKEIGYVLIGALHVYILPCFDFNKIWLGLTEHSVYEMNSDLILILTLKYLNLCKILPLLFQYGN